MRDEEIKLDDAEDATYTYEFVSPFNMFKVESARAYFSAETAKQDMQETINRINAAITNFRQSQKNRRQSESLSYKE